MARIDMVRLKKVNKQRNTIHDKVLGTYTVFDYNGDKFLQIDTYGKFDREMPEKISQSFQIDKETACFLVNMLIKEFNLKY